MVCSLSNIENISEVDMKLLKISLWQLFQKNTQYLIEHLGKASLPMTADLPCLGKDATSAS